LGNFIAYTGKYAYYHFSLTLLNISAFTASSHNLPSHFVFTRYLGAPALSTPCTKCR